MTRKFHRINKQHDRIEKNQMLFNRVLNFMIIRRALRNFVQGKLYICKNICILENLGGRAHK